MTTPVIANIQKEIAYDRQTRDFAMHIIIDGARQFIGYAPNHHEAEITTNQFVYDFLMDSQTIETAAELLMRAA